MGKVERFALAPSGDYDFFLGDDTYQVGCFSWYDDDLLNNISAGIIARHVGYSSIDYVRKRYCQEPRDRSDPDAPARLALQAVHNLIANRYKSFQPRTDSSLQTVVFDQAFYRAYGTMKTAMYLARRGLIFETALVARGFIEQIAWARRAGECADEDGLFQINIHKAITALKGVYPTVGRLYGQLSSLSHFDPSNHSVFYGNLENEVATVFASRETKFAAMEYPFVMIDIWQAVFEDFYGKRRMKGRLKKKNGEFNANRVAVSMFRKYYGGFEDFVSPLFAEPW